MPLGNPKQTDVGCKADQTAVGILHWACLVITTHDVIRTLKLEQLLVISNILVCRYSVNTHTWMQTRHFVALFQAYLGESVPDIYSLTNMTWTALQHMVKCTHTFIHDESGFCSGTHWVFYGHMHLLVPTHSAKETLHGKPISCVLF